ncbi:MAG TPA: monooxygenase [Anaerolineae bacterium]|nr:monooxygenase [Anaerolineae bacterium]
MKQVGQHAIVIGASMSGLLAARALADYYQQVTLLERDTFPAPGEQRKGVPQGRHTHALLAKGREALEDFFPGLTQQLVEQDAVLSDALADALRFIGGGYYCQIQSNKLSLLVSRPLLESQVRSRLLALSNVRVIENCDVLGLVAAANQSQVSGVRLRRRLAGSAEEILQGDLVVDASGRGSRAPAWLEALGYPTPEEELVAAGMGYVSRIYRRKTEHLQGAKVVQVIPTSEIKRGAVMLAQEGNRWILTLTGYPGDQPSSDEQGFLEFARGLPAPDIYELIKHAEPLSDPLPAKFPTNMRRRYEWLTRFPTGFLVIGDAICSFNPVYGQGMTVAALEAAALHECLAQGGAEQLASRFFKKVSQVVDIPWNITVGNDRRFVEPEKSANPMARFINWYMGKLHIAARRDPVAALAFLKVTNLMAPPASVLNPRIALRVLWGNLRPAKAVSSATGKSAPALMRG